MLAAALASDPETLNARAAQYYSQGNYAKAEPLFLEAISELPAEDAGRHGLYWNNLAAVYRALGRYSEADAMYSNALPALASSFGVDSAEYRNALGNRAELYLRDGKAAVAEADALQLLAAAVRFRGRLDEAESLLKRSLAIREGAVAYTNLAEIYSTQGKFTEAGRCARRALAMYEKTLGLNHPLVAVGLNGLAQVLRQQSADLEVEPLFIRALGMLDPKTPEYQLILANLNNYYKSRGLHGSALEARRERSTNALKRPSLGD